jgi:hypothetical protein
MIAAALAIIAIIGWLMAWLLWRENRALRRLNETIKAAYAEYRAGIEARTKLSMRIGINARPLLKALSDAREAIDALRFTGKETHQ